VHGEMHQECKAPLNKRSGMDRFFLSSVSMLC